MNKTSTESHVFVLQRVQPALMGLMDGSISTLAPLFATAEITHNSHSAFLIGLAASVGAAVSMGLAEALSDDGQITGRGNPVDRGFVIGLATLFGGMFHTLPFLINNISFALRLAYLVVAIELATIAYIRFHFMETPLVKTIIQVIVGGGVVFLIGVMLGRFGS